MDQAVPTELDPGRDRHEVEDRCREIRTLIDHDGVTRVRQRNESAIRQDLLDHLACDLLAQDRRNTPSNEEYRTGHRSESRPEVPLERHEIRRLNRRTEDARIECRLETTIHSHDDTRSGQLIENLGIAVWMNQTELFPELGNLCVASKSIPDLVGDMNSARRIERRTSIDEYERKHSLRIGGREQRRNVPSERMGHDVGTANP